VPFPNLKTEPDYRNYLPCRQKYLLPPISGATPVTIGKTRRWQDGIRWGFG